MPQTQLLHPLSGADIGTLVRVLRRFGPVSPARYPHAGIALGAAIGRLPFTLWERGRTRRLLAEHPEMPAPVFILGHWRSGTTHLYNILGKDPAFGYVPPLATGMPWDLFGIVTLLRPMLERALPKHRFIDNVAVNPDSPQEDEAALANMTPLSFYHALYFPRHFRRAFLEGVFFDGASPEQIAAWRDAFVLFLRKVSIHQGGKPLIVKNPVYTARVPMIREIWPDARFIHIRRNPYVVFQSMRNFHFRLCAALGLQTDTPADVEAVVLETYARMMDRLEQDSADIPANQFIDIRFEDLEANPLSVLERVYGQLSLGDWDTARPRFEGYLSTVRGYAKNRYGFEPADLERVDRAWGAHVAAGGYAPPA